jgi:hypothetical protein
MVLPKSGMEEKQRELSFGFNRSSCLVKQLRSLQAQHFADISAGRQNFRIDKIKENLTAQYAGCQRTELCYTQELQHNIEIAVPALAHT